MTIPLKIFTITRVLCAGALLALVGIYLVFPAFAADAPAFDRIPVEIRTARHTYPLRVEVALTAEQQKTGLMHRKTLETDGMLFVFGNPQFIRMWMKNTFLPLDMVFIGVDGRVVDVAENATPLSEEVITSKKPALAVLELPAGSAKKMHLTMGDSLVAADYFPR